MKMDTTPLSRFSGNLQQYEPDVTKLTFEDMRRKTDLPVTSDILTNGRNQVM
jgi:hypothetical protein